MNQLAEELILSICDHLAPQPTIYDHDSLEISSALLALSSTSTKMRRICRPLAFRCIVLALANCDSFCTILKPILEHVQILFVKFGGPAHSGYQHKVFIANISLIINFTITRRLKALFLSLTPVRKHEREDLIEAFDQVILSFPTLVSIIIPPVRYSVFRMHNSTWGYITGIISQLPIDSFDIHEGTVNHFNPTSIPTYLTFQSLRSLTYRLNLPLQVATFLSLVSHMLNLHELQLFPQPPTIAWVDIDVFMNDIIQVLTKLTQLQHFACHIALDTHIDQQPSDVAQLQKYWVEALARRCPSLTRISFGHIHSGSGQLTTIPWIVGRTWNGSAEYLASSLQSNI